MFENYEYQRLSLRYETLSSNVSTLIQSFAPNDAYYSQEVKQALKRLKAVIVVQNRLNNWIDYCWPRGQYPSVNHMNTYDICSIETMKNVRVETITLDNDGVQYGKLMSNVSLGEAMERLQKKAFRHSQFKELWELIKKDMIVMASINSICAEYCKKMQVSLYLLRDLVCVVNQGPNWTQLCEDSGWDSEKIIDHYDLSSAASMLTQEITARGVRHFSLKKWLTKIDNLEKTKYLFNELYKQVMPEVYHLQELANQYEQPAANLMKSHAIYIADALRRLYDAIILEHEKINNLQYGNFSTIKNMLAARISGEMSLREAILLTDDTRKTPETLQRLISDVLESMHTNTLDFVRPLGQTYTMYDGIHASIVVAKTLCRLVECGDVDQIQAIDPSLYDVDLLIGSPIQLQVSTLLKDVIYTYSYPLSVYAGIYNALILAVLYRHTNIVRYFLEKGANPQIKGGRFHDLSAETCVSLRIPGLKPAPAELIQLFQELPTIKRNFGNNVNFYKQPSDHAEEGTTESARCVIS